MHVATECAFEQLAELEAFGILSSVHLVCKRDLLMVTGGEEADLDCIV